MADEQQIFYNMIMQMPMGVLVMKGIDMRIEVANDIYLQIADRKEHEVKGKLLLDAMPELKGQGIVEMLYEVFKTGKAQEGNELKAQVKRRGKIEEAYFNFIFHPIKEIDGTSSGVMAVATEVTNIVNARMTLSESERQFRNFVMQSHIAKGIFRGKDMVIELANDALLRIWNRSREEVTGQKLLDVFPELLDQKFPQLLEQVYDTGITYIEKESLTYIDSKKGRNKYYLDVVYAPLIEPDSSTSGIMVTVVNVTEQVTARERLEESETRSRIAIESANLGTFELNLQTREFIYSERLAEIFGLKASPEVVYDHFIERFHTDDLPLREKKIAEALLSGNMKYDLRVVWSDGSVHWLQLSGKVIYDEKRQPLRMHGSGLDMTEQRLAAEEIDKNASRFKLLADFMPQQIWTSDDKGNLNYYNKAVFDYSGFTPERIEEEGWLSIVHPDDREENIKQWVHSVTTGENFIFEHRFRKHDGEYRWQLSRALPQKDAQGNIQLWIGTSTDIHDRKMLTDELEKHVEQRTSELKRANEDLIRTNNELEQFAFIASHDLQEPLRKIRTFTTMLQEKTPDAAQSVIFLDKIHTSAERMSFLIRDVLNYSRIVKTDDAYIVTDLNEIFKNVVADFELLIEQKKAVVTSTILPVLTVIPLQFNQLFTNLIGNALKFSDESPIITVTAGPAAFKEVKALGELNPKAKYIKLTFRDNGIGFEQQYADKIFTIFQRLNDKSKYSGTGIGLAMCKKIVENHHGFITAQSTPGEGATFNVYLLAGYSMV